MCLRDKSNRMFIIVYRDFRMDGQIKEAADQGIPFIRLKYDEPAGF